MPEIYNALETDVELPEEAGGNRHADLRGGAAHRRQYREGHLDAADRRAGARGAPVRDTGGPITVPVGDVVKGHVFNALGKPLDIEESELDLSERWGIHRKPPAFDQLEGSTQMMETGIKVIDLLTPYIQGGKIGLFGGAGVGKTVLIQEMITRVARELRRHVGLRRCRRADS